MPRDVHCGLSKHGFTARDQRHIVAGRRKLSTQSQADSARSTSDQGVHFGAPYANSLLLCRSPPLANQPKAVLKGSMRGKRRSDHGGIGNSWKRVTRPSATVKMCNHSLSNL